MAKKKPPKREWFWARLATEKDIDVLRNRLAQKGPLWSEWQYKLHRGNIIVYDALLPYDLETHTSDSTRREWVKHLRIAPCPPPGPFQLEYMRHTGQWWPLPYRESIEKLAEIIASQDGLWMPMCQLDWERHQKGK